MKPSLFQDGRAVPRNCRPCAEDTAGWILRLERKGVLPSGQTASGRLSCFISSVDKPPTSRQDSVAS